jgi:hypothetical protein
MAFNLRPIQRSARILPILFILTACGSGDRTDEGSGKSFSETEQQKEEEKAGSERSKKRTFFGVPTPHQMLKLLESYDHEPAMDELLDPASAKESVNSDHRAVLLGIYSTDLAYASVFGSGDKSLDYFRTVRELGDELDVSSAFDKETVRKIEKAVGSSDSLKDISKGTYLEVFRYLERNERGKTLALMVAGGWTEALYLSVEMVDGYEKEDPAMDYIAQEKASFQNVRSFMKKYEEHESVGALLERMEGLKKAYRSLERVEGEASKMEEEGGKMVVSGGSSLKLDRKGLERIRKEVRSLRKAMVEWKLSSSS